MSATGLPVFDETLHLTNTWLHEVSEAMGWEERQKSYRLLRVALHALRDRMEVNAAAKLSAQLPMLIRGIYYEGWRPSQVPSKVRTQKDFLRPLRDAFSEDGYFDPERAFREVLAVMRRHVSEGELEEIRRAMPSEIRDLWSIG